MKLKNKFLLVFIVFIGFFILNSLDCFAATSVSLRGSTYTFPDFDNLLTSSLTQGVVLYSTSDNTLHLRICNSGERYETVDGITETSLTPYPHVEFDDSYNHYNITYNKDIWYKLSDDGSGWVKYSSHDSSSSFYMGSYYDVVYCNKDLWFREGENKGYWINFQTQTPEIEPDKLNLFELNMVDLDDNRKKHKFNLCTYTNSDCYDELMNYYNNDYRYSIYLTDYERILTYQNYDDDNSFLYGSYVISGYIDFLITEKSFFYYSKYYNQVLSDSGNSFLDKDIENYTKRFYFKLTYSDDSNDPHANIWTDNGNLYKIDYLESFEDRYFVGSSQTIYYSVESSKGNFQSLSKNIYYLGYLNPTGGKTRDISDTPFYVYNFDYAGGSTELYIVNQTDYNYDEMIKSRYDNWEKYYDDWTIVTDGSTGGSYIQGNDFTSSTFPEGSVTDNTDVADDESYIGEIRTSSDDTDSIDKNKENESNIADGSIFSNLINTIKDKFNFSNNIVNNANEIKDFLSNTQETHKYYLNINSKYLSGNICIIDLSWYEPYKPTVDAFILAFAYLAFIWHMFCRLPNIISGASASSYLSDIVAYKNTGFGRSSNIHKGGF